MNGLDGPVGVSAPAGPPRESAPPEVAWAGAVRAAALVAEASAALLGSLNVRFCTEEAVRLAARHLADAAVVVTAPVRGRLQTVAAVTGGAPASASVDATAQDVPGLDEALCGFPPVPSRWLDPARMPPWLVPDGFGRVGSVIVTPLPGHGAAAGALVLLRRVGAAGFDDGDEATTRGFATTVGTAMSAARMFTAQAAITETLMRELLPPTLRDVAGADVAARYRPGGATGRVGGDFYDVHPVERTGDATESLVVLGDVCGKGLDAAMLAGKIRTTVQALTPFAGDHARLLGLLNRSLLTDDHTRFATLVLASLTRVDAEVRLRISCAGHPAPLVVRANGQVEEVASRGTLIGVLPDVRVGTAEVVLAPGDVCLLFTDGVTEARGPVGDDQFGEHRLAEALAECAGTPAEAVVERVMMLVGRWVGDAAHDDMALLAIGAPRGRHLTAVGGHGPGRYTA